MSKQPEALRLAQHVESEDANLVAMQVVVELRRLHAINAELLEALKTARNRLGDVLIGDDGQALKEAKKAMPAIDAAIAKAGEQP